MLVEVGDSTKSICRKPAKTSENNKHDSHLFFFLAAMTHGCVLAFHPHRIMESLCISYSFQRENFFNYPKEIHVLKRRHWGGGGWTYDGSLLVSFAHLIKVSPERFFLRKAFTKSERSDWLQPGKNFKINEHFSCSIRSYKISLLIYLGSIEIQSPSWYTPHLWSCERVCYNFRCRKHWKWSKTLIKLLQTYYE